MQESTEFGTLRAPADVFISYSRSDSDRVLELVESLRERGVAVWVDQGGIAGGSHWREEIVKAITDCRVFIFAASNSSFESDNVSRELSLASEESKTILPLMLEPVDVPARYRYQLSEHQWLSLYGEEEEAALKSIFRALKTSGVSLQKGKDSAGTSNPGRARKDRNVPVRAGFLIALLVTAVAGAYDVLTSWMPPAALASVIVLAFALPPILRLAWRATNRRAREPFSVGLSRSFGALLGLPALWFVGILAVATLTDDVQRVFAEEKPVVETVGGLLVGAPEVLAENYPGVVCVFVLPDEDPGLDAFLDPDQTNYKPIAKAEVTSGRTVFFPDRDGPRPEFDESTREELETWGPQWKRIATGEVLPPEMYAAQGELRVIWFRFDRGVDAALPIKEKMMIVGGKLHENGWDDIPPPPAGKVIPIQLTKSQ